MSLKRSKLASVLVEKAGSSIAKIINPGSGWPSRILIRKEENWIPIDLYISTISSHARKAYEVRFQNPGDESQRPIIQRDAMPILMGYAEIEGKPICVAADATRRIGSHKRFSILFHKSLLTQAAKLGWAEYHSASDEVITAFHATLLPAYLSMQSFGASIPSEGIINAIGNTGFNSNDIDRKVIERARQVVSKLVRDWAFRKTVIDAYNGKCALCGLNWGLIEAAHIYPASAPGSPDTIGNGLGLCGNHHILFDSHKLHINPNSRKVKIHPGILNNANEPGRVFLEKTFPVLTVPVNASHHPDQEMLIKRYSWFKEAYKWSS